LPADHLHALDRVARDDAQVFVALVSFR